MVQILDRIKSEVLNAETPKKYNYKGKEQQHMVCREVVRSKLKDVATVGRKGVDRNFWTLMPIFKLPTKQEVELGLKDALFKLE